MRDQPNRSFPAEEYATRTAKAQALMQQRGIAGMLLTTEAEVRYFSGFQTLFWQSPTRPWFLFIPHEGTPVAIIPEIGADLMRRTWVKDIRTWSAPRPDDDGLSLLVDLLSPFAEAGHVIATPKGHETCLRMPLGDYERLITDLPGIQMADATPILRTLRMVKSEREIEKLSHICEIGSRAFSAMPDLASIGQPLDVLFRVFRQQLLEEGADDVPYLVGGADQGGYSDVISPPDTRTLQAGDILMLDTGATWDGYFCDFDRNFAIGHSSDTARRTYAALWEATETGLETARPGATCKEVLRAMENRLFGASGVSGDIGRFGHGLGMQLTEWPSLALFDDTVLEENMVLTLEPSMSYGAGQMMVHEENIVIRKDGAELLTRRAPPELPVI